MCWSAPVSLFFASAMIVTAIYLWFRNEGYDRTGIFLALPLISQETLQFFLWLDIGQSPTECSDYNRFLSLVVVFVISSIAFTVSITSRLSWTLLTSNNIKKWWARAIALQIVVYICGCGYFVWGFITGGLPLCTYPGAYGHQMWPACYAWPVGYHYTFFMTYSSFIGLGFYFFQGPVYVVVIQIVSASAMPILYFFYGAEAGSIWCWSACTQIFLFAAVPYMRPTFAEYGFLKPLNYEDDVPQFPAFRFAGWV